MADNWDNANISSPQKNEGSERLEEKHLHYRFSLPADFMKNFSFRARENDDAY